MEVSNAVCAACNHQIDAAAKICPYCGADPTTGEKAVDTQALLRETFHLDRKRGTSAVLDFARQRQGIVVAVGVLVVLVVLGALHQFVTARNATVTSSNPAVPLTDITDLSSQPNEAAQMPMPPLQFQYDGNPQSMRTYIMEPGAVTPPDVVAAQQAAAQAAAAQKTPQPAAPAAGAKPAPPANTAVRPNPQPQPSAPSTQPH